MKILLTGSTGFIGKRVLKELLDRNYEVIVLSGSESKETNVIPSLDYKFNDNYFLENGCEDVEIIIHVGAWIPKETKVADDIELSLSNITSTKALITSKLPKLRKIIFLSTIDVYANVGEAIDENTLTNPSTMYGWSKLYCEKMIQSFCKQKNLSYEILRIGHVYGEGEEVYKKVMPTMIKQALQGNDLTIYGDGEAIRTFIYIDDVAKTIVNSINYDKSEIINVVGNEEITINELAEVIKEECDNKINIFHIDNNIKNRNLCFNNKKLMNTLIDSLTPFNEGIKKEIEYMKDILQ